MIYKISGNVIYKDDTKVGDITFQGSGMRLYQIIFTGPVSLTLERSGRGFKIIDGGMDMGKTGRGLEVEYNFQFYRPRRDQLRRFIMNSVNSIEIEASGNTAFTINRVADGFTIDCTDATALVPAFVMYSLLSQYASSGGTYNRFQGYAQVPGIYRGVSLALSLGALVFLYSIDVGFLPTYLSLTLFFVLIVCSYVVRFAGRRAARRKGD